MLDRVDAGEDRAAHAFGGRGVGRDSAPGGMGDLKPGMFSRVGIVFERRAEALSVPRVALLDTDGSSNLFIVSGGKAEQRAIKVGLSNAGRIEVVEGLTGGEQVVIVGQNGLKDGNPVRVVTLDQTAQAVSKSGS